MVADNIIKIPTKIRHPHEGTIHRVDIRMKNCFAYIIVENHPIFKREEHYCLVHDLENVILSSLPYGSFMTTDTYLLTDTIKIYTVFSNTHECLKWKLKNG